MTPEEIQEVKGRAEKERQKHHRIMSIIQNVSPISYDKQYEIVKRRRDDEVLALLKKERTIDEKVQLYIYDNKNVLPRSYDYMLRNTKLCLIMEKKLFDEKVYLYSTENDNKCYLVEFSPAGEEYMVEQTLANCKGCNRITTELTFLNIYTQQRQLSSQGDTALMQFLNVNAGRDSTINTLQRFVIDYIAKYRGLSDNAAVGLIESGNHHVIMYFLEQVKELPTTSSFTSALEERGNRKEIEKYYERFAYE